MAPVRVFHLVGKASVKKKCFYYAFFRIKRRGTTSGKKKAPDFHARQREEVYFNGNFGTPATPLIPHFLTTPPRSLYKHRITIFVRMFSKILL